MGTIVLNNYIKLLGVLVDEYIDPLILINPVDASILYANSSACSTIGYTASDLTQLKFGDIQELFKSKSEWESFSASVWAKKTITFQGYHKHKEGFILPVQTRIKHVVLDKESYFLACLSYSVEKAGFVENNNTDNIEEGFYKSLIENYPGGIAIINIENVFLYINAALENISGYSKWEIIGKYLLEFVHTNDIELAANIFAKTIEEHSDTIEGTIRFRHKELGWRYIELKSVNLSDNYFVKGIFVSFQDVTEKYEIQQKQRIQKNNLLKIINEVPVLLYAKNWQGQYTLANERFALNLGTNVDALIGKTSYDFIHIPELVATHDRLDKEVMVKYEYLPPFEQLYKDPISGKEQWFEISKIPIIFEDNSVHCLSVAIDITERIAFHDKLMAKNTALQKANKELDRFVYSASHELRAPLTSVLGLVSLAEYEQDIESIIEYFRMIKQAINRLDQCIINIINYSRNERVEVQSQPITFSNFIDDILNGLQYIDETKKIRYIINIEQQEPFYIDLSRLQIIFNNLISNAIKYHNYRQSSPWIKIDIKCLNDKAIIEISDNGVGIKPEHQHKIFDMFFRANSSAPGSGLGLYIVQETIHKMNGTIQLQNNTTEGALFRIELPSVKPAY